MANTISFKMIEESTSEHCLWSDQPYHIARELYPDSEVPEGDFDYDTLPVTESGATEAGLIALSVQWDLQVTLADHKHRRLLPEWLQSDQIEDWLVARAVRNVLVAKTTAALVRPGANIIALMGVEKAS